MKKADLEKHQSMKVVGAMKREATPERFGAASGEHVGKREQREMERAAGLVPFAVKLPQDLVASLQALAKKRGVSLNEVTAEMLQKALND
jgi:predicted HicB family RNase H-like nuclease